MFAAQRNEENLINTSKLAKANLEAWKSLLSYRISLQRPLDAVNKLPQIEYTELSDILEQSIDEDDHLEIKEAYSSLQSTLESMQSELYSMLRVQSNLKASSKKNLLRQGKTNLELIGWENMVAVQNDLEESWSKTLNKWHARMHFGSEKAKDRLKVFNVNVWDQLNDTLSDDYRALEKSRMPLQDAERLDIKELVNSANEVFAPIIDQSNPTQAIQNYRKRGIWVDSLVVNVESEKKGGHKRMKAYDLEVYDDRNFYSLLLKTFIVQHAGGENSTSAMRTDDLAALRKFKIKKQNVDRKASKGRRIRYTVHSKLQNFMFPVPFANQNELGFSMDSERLFTSLFQ